MPCPSATDPIDATPPEFPRDTRSRCVFDTWLHPSFVTYLRELSPRGPGTVRLTYLCRMACIEQHGARRIQPAALIQTRMARLCQWAGWPVHGRKLARNGDGATHTEPLRSRTWTTPSVISHPSSRAAVVDTASRTSTWSGMRRRSPEAMLAMIVCDATRRFGVPLAWGPASAPTVISSTGSDETFCTSIDPDRTAWTLVSVLRSSNRIRQPIERDPGDGCRPLGRQRDARDCQRGEKSPRLD